MTHSIERWRKELEEQKGNTALAVAKYEQRLKDKGRVQRQLEERAEELKITLPNLAAGGPWFHSAVAECVQCIEEVEALRTKQQEQEQQQQQQQEHEQEQEHKKMVEGGSQEIQPDTQARDGQEESVATDQPEGESEQDLMTVMQELYEESRKEARAAAGCIEAMKEKEELKRLLDRLEMAKQNMFQKIRSKKWEEMLAGIRGHQADTQSPQTLQDASYATQEWFNGIPAAAAAVAAKQ